MNRSTLFFIVVFLSLAFQSNWSHAEDNLITGDQNITCQKFPQEYSRLKNHLQPFYEWMFANISIGNDKAILIGLGLSEPVRTSNLRPILRFLQDEDTSAPTTLVDLYEKLWCGFEYIEADQRIEVFHNLGRNLDTNQATAFAKFLTFYTLSNALNAELLHELEDLSSNSIENNREYKRRLSQYSELLTYTLTILKKSNKSKILSDLRIGIPTQTHSIDDAVSGTLAYSSALLNMTNIFEHSTNTNGANLKSIDEKVNEQLLFEITDNENGLINSAILADVNKASKEINFIKGRINEHAKNINKLFADLSIMDRYLKTYFEILSNLSKSDDDENFNAELSRLKQMLADRELLNSNQINIASADASVDCPEDPLGNKNLEAYLLCFNADGITRAGELRDKIKNFGKQISFSEHNPLKNSELSRCFQNSKMFVDKHSTQKIRNVVTSCFAEWLWKVDALSAVKFLESLNEVVDSK